MKTKITSQKKIITGLYKSKVLVTALVDPASDLKAVILFLVYVSVRSPPVKFFSKLNHLFFGYFDPIHNFFDNKNKYFSG